jgi:hypothetical protein
MSRLRFAITVWGLSWCGWAGAEEVPLLPACATPAKTMFEWGIGPDAEPEEDDGEEEPIVTDRPDFTESSSTVGLGRLQLEMGYTYTSGDDDFRSHSYPEVLLRIGLFAEWFELRIVQNFASEFEPPTSVDGNEDLGLGFKLALTEQKGYLPETGLIVESSIPTGHADLTDDELLPAITYLYGWDIIPGRLDMGGETQFARARDDTGHFYLQMAQSWTFGYGLTEKLGAYTEWFAFFPDGALASDIGPEHYLDGGFTYLISNNLQVDIEAGVGLNEHSDNYFVGAGMAVRW